MDIDIKQIRELMRAMKQLQVNELEIEGGDQRIYLRRGANGVAMPQTVAVAPGDDGGRAVGAAPGPGSCRAGPCRAGRGSERGLHHVAVRRDVLPCALPRPAVIRPGG